jgi:hypothetical protein
LKDFTAFDANTGGLKKQYRGANQLMEETGKIID